jgi:hypothetical protein
MPISVERFDARSWLEEQLELLFGGAFPAYITADARAKIYIGGVRAWFGAFNVMLVSDDQPVATGWAARSGGPARSTTSPPAIPTPFVALSGSTNRAVEPTRSLSAEGSSTDRCTVAAQRLSSSALCVIYRLRRPCPASSHRCVRH